MNPRAEILLVGGGIGGLCAGIALRRQGFPVQVLEQAAELRPLGAGLTLQINAMLALRQIGLDAAVAAEGQEISRGRVRTWEGKVLSEVPLGELARELGAPCIGIHRGALQRVLVDALGPSSLRLGARVAAITAGEGEREVAVTLADGAQLRGEVLIGADGVHSTVRRHLHGEEPAEYAGYTAWRGICDNDGTIPASAVSESWGEATRFGIVPVGHGQIYWFATSDAPQGGEDGADPRAELQRRFAGWHDPIQRLLALTPPERILRTDICDRAPLSTRGRAWGRGHLTLLGDAAHPMTPNLGQGACQAIEDAVVLGRLMAEEPDPAAALRGYEERRRDRAETIVKMARRLGQVGQLANPVARAIRDTLVHLAPDALNERQLRWLFTFAG